MLHRYKHHKDLPSNLQRSIDADFFELLPNASKEIRSHEREISAK